MQKISLQSLLWNRGQRPEGNETMEADRIGSNYGNE